MSLSAHDAISLERNDAISLERNLDGIRFVLNARPRIKRPIESGRNKSREMILAFCRRRGNETTHHNNSRTTQRRS